jgi:ferredoxin
VRIQIDADRCTGHGRCYALAPELFDCDDDGHGEVRADVRDAGGDAHRSGVLADDQVPRAKLAVDNCPEAAISLVED